MRCGGYASMRQGERRSPPARRHAAGTVMCHLVRWRGRTSADDEWLREELDSAGSLGMKPPGSVADGPRQWWFTAAGVQ